jgi:hypothetical protein
MPRPSINLDQWKQYIVDLYIDGAQPEAIASDIQMRTGLPCSKRTIQRRLLQWEAPHHRKRSVITDELRERIVTLFLLGTSERDMLRILRQDGFTIEPRRLQRIRLEESTHLLRSTRWINEADEDAQIVKLQEIVEEELEKGTIEDFGRTHLYYHFRALGHRDVVITYKRLFDAVKRANPQGVRRRLSHHVRVRRKLRVPGPNFMWSIDAHDKLERFGFEIYAGIDSYARYITWCYCGVSAHTQFAIFAQYIKVVEEHGYFPFFLRSDRGVETVMAAEAHLALHKKSDPSTSFPKVYRYGTSKKNQRVESWWQQMSKSTLRRWREYFEELEADGLWDEDLLSCKIALLAVYMPILRRLLHRFVDQWNHHRIRRQKNRPHVVPGQPYVLFYYPETPQNFQQFISPDLLADFKADIGGYDIDEYLPRDTLAWCSAQLQSWGYSNLSGEEVLPQTGQRVHRDAYLHLRNAIDRHMQDGNREGLDLCRPPTGGRDYIPPPAPHTDPEVIADEEDSGIEDSDEETEIEVRVYEQEE